MQAKAVFKWQGSLLALFQGDQVICPGLKGPKINHSICSCLSPFLVTNTQPLGWFLRHDSGKGRVGSAQILNTFFRCCTRTNNEENVNTGSGGWQGTNTDCHPAKVLVLLEFTLSHWNTLFECCNFCTFSGSCSTELPEAVSQHWGLPLSQHKAQMGHILWGTSSGRVSWKPCPPPQSVLMRGQIVHHRFEMDSSVLLLQTSKIQNYLCHITVLWTWTINCNLPIFNSFQTSWAVFCSFAHTVSFFWFFLLLELYEM